MTIIDLLNWKWNYSQRPNTTAWVALRDRLGIPAHTEATAPVAAGRFWNLRNFTFTDANNYAWRLFAGDSSVLDAEGYFLADEVRETKTGGVLQAFVRNRLFWTGSEWFDCGDSGVAAIRVNSRAPFDSSYCKSYNDERASVSTVTLDGRRMSDVVRDIRRYGSKDGAFDYRNWGPDPAVHTSLANAFFPAGSRMEYRGITEKAKPVSIATAAGDQLRIPPADPSVPFNTWPFATSLNNVVANYPGDLLGGAVTASRTLFVWRKFLPSAPSPDVTNEVEIRAAFDAAGAKARFYECNRTINTGFRVNCTVVLNTTYAVETLGSARVMKFAAMPPNFETDFRFNRMFAEYAGGVWYAFQDYVSPTPNYSIRLSREASEALFGALGIR